MAARSDQLVVHLLMIFTQLIAGAYYVITRFGLDGGLNRIVLSLYRDILAMCCLIPAAYIIDRRNPVKLTGKVILQLLILGLTGIYGSNYLTFAGIEYTNPAAAASFQPFIPVLTAVIAIIFRTEQVHWRRRDGQLKLAGIVCSSTGALVMTFYIGPVILSSGLGTSSPVTSSHIEMASSMGSAGMNGLELAGWHISRWHLGSIFLMGSSLCMAAFINLQAPLLKKIPAPVSVLTYAYAFGALLMGITGYFSVPDSTEWTLGFDSRLAVVLYNGIISSALNFAIMGWCLSRVGPVFVASYIPMQPVVAAVMAVIFLGTDVCLGTGLGMVFITSGLLLVSFARKESLRLDGLPGNIAADEPVAKSEKDALKDPLIQVGHT